MSNPRCTYIKADGTQCGAYAMDGSDGCFWHSGGAAAASQKGAARVAEQVKEAAEVRSRLAAPKQLSISDWEDMRKLCCEKIATVPPQFCSWWVSNLVKCLEHTVTKKPGVYVVYTEPLPPDEPIPPLPKLPGYTFPEDA